MQILRISIYPYIGMRPVGSLVPRLVLASASPNRRAILESCGIEVESMAADIDEQPLEHERPVELTTRLAETKCETVTARLSSSESSGSAVVIAADTVVENGGLILGKPQSRDEGHEMLLSLSGGTHNVITGVAVAFGGATIVDHAVTAVTFRSLKEPEIVNYLDTGDYKGKAGAYGIQGIASVFVEQIDGSHHNVVGLPTHVVERSLQALGRSIYDWRVGR